MNDDNIKIHISANKPREGILDHQVEKCPHCGGPLSDGYGMAGGGFGAYQYCEKCEVVVSKCCFEL